MVNIQDPGIKFKLKLLSISLVGCQICLPSPEKRNLKIVKWKSKFLLS